MKNLVPTSSKAFLRYTMYSYSCVLHTAVDAYNKGFKIVVYEKAVASFNAQGHEYALGHFKSCLNAEVK